MGFEQITLHDKSNFIHPTAIIYSNVELGSNNYIGPYVVIGSPPQSKQIDPRTYVGKVIIGSNNVIREFVSIHSGTSFPTTIGNNNEIYMHAHIAHDCFVENNCVIAGHSSVAGHVYIMKGAFLGTNCSVHQKSIIGSYSILGLGSAFNGCIEPGQKYMGNPAKHLGLNLVGLERSNVSKYKLSQEQKRFEGIKLKWIK